MASDGIRADLARLQKDAAPLHKALAKHEEDAAKARAAASAKRKSAAGSRSASTIQSNLRSAEAEDKKAVAAAKKVGEVQDKLAAIAKRQSEKQRSLTAAIRTEQATQDRGDQRRRRAEEDHVRKVARLSRQTVHHIVIRPPEPEILRVLCMTASPVGAPEDALRVDAEVNSVLRAVRSSKYGGIIDVQPRPAATPDDLINGINDHRPHVVHFSGHAGTPGLLFDNASLLDPGEQMVGYRKIARLLLATDEAPTLVVLNACDTADGALELLEAVPIVIAMSAPVGDASAAVFATQFYGAIGGAQSIGHAAQQAVTATEIALGIEMDFVTVCARPEVNPDDVILVKPTEGRSPLS